MRTIRLGAGAGYSGDRIEPAVELAEKGQLDYLVFECLAERTIALAQQARLSDPDAGYDPMLEQRFAAVLRPCTERRIKIVTNMGAANAQGAARHVARIARRMGLAGLKIAAVSGDDVTDIVRHRSLQLTDTEGTTNDIAERMISANAYLGAAPVVEALQHGADIVVTGRIGDPALFLAPLMHEFGWAMDDWDRLGKGTVVGHLLECAGQVTGGYFSDPGLKDVPDLARLGYPIAEVQEDGSAVITKVAGSGGRVGLDTCKEQLLYEIHDPACYYQPDVIADFTSVRFEVAGLDRVAVSGGTGRKRPDTLKISIGYHDSFIGEGQISYAGLGALVRARLALQIVEERFDLIGLATRERRFELIGVNSVCLGARPEDGPEPGEVRIRVVGRTISLREAQRVGDEVETLYTNGPAGGGGAWKSAREIVAVVSTLLPQTDVHPSVSYEVT